MPKQQKCGSGEKGKAAGDIPGIRKGGIDVVSFFNLLLRAIWTLDWHPLQLAIGTFDLGITCHARTVATAWSPCAL